jgi:GTPase SAR1 family protein
MEKQGELHHSTVHGVFIGPARSGKNSLMERLLGKMPSSKSPSTGVAEAVVQVQVQKSCTMVANVEGSVWSRIDYDDEAIRLMILHSDQEKVQFEAPAVTSTATDIFPFTAVSVEGYESALIAPLNIKHKVPNKHEDQLIATPMLHTSSTEHLPASYVPPLDILKTAIKSKGLQALQQHFEKTWSLYLSNTGGQMEFQEVLPLLVSGPCMFFYTFRLDRGLNECYEIHYELPDGTTSDPYKSSISTIEGIVQSLASIAAMGIFVYRGSQKRKVRLRPKILFIGTHRDRLNKERATDIIASFDQNLQKSTAQFSNLIEFASKDQMMFAVNNFSEDDTVFQEIRSSVECIVERHEFEMLSPSRWLIYSLALRRLKAEIATYEECFEIAKQCGIFDEEELTEALHFIHTKMGLIRYFPFEHIKDIVIIQPQILYDKISELIVKTFTFEKAGKKSADLFNEKGIFSLDDFERIHRKSDSSSAMEPTQFAGLLKALHIAAPFGEGSGGDGERKLFFPCILGHASEAQEQIEISSLEISPLNVTFKCGYCPKGLGGALINYLMTNGTNFNFEWNLLTDQIFRDQVSFEVGPLDTVILRIFLTHLMLIFVPEHNFPDRSTCCIEDVCCDIRKAVDIGIRKIVQALNFIPSEVEPSFTFLCPCVKCGNKCPAEMKLRHDKPFCLCCTKSRSKHQLPKGYDKWFATNPQVQSIVTKEVIDHDHERTRLSELHHPALLAKLTKYASRWRNVGEKLKFTSDELDNIEARPLLLQRAPTSWLREMLAEWLQWTPGDSRGSRDFATLEALKFALNEAGLAAAASDLQL